MTTRQPPDDRSRMHWETWARSVCPDRRTYPRRISWTNYRRRPCRANPSRVWDLGRTREVEPPRRLPKADPPNTPSGYPSDS